MTRNRLAFLAAIFLFPYQSLATRDSPILQGFAGAGRSGIPTESLQSNPAGVWLLQQSSAFFYYTKPNVPEVEGGGRAYSVGLYDGENPSVKGGFGYLRNSRVRVQSGATTYEDRSEFRFSAGRPISGEILAGINGRYVTVRNGGDETKFFQGDIGAIFPLFKDVRAGVTYENVVEKAVDNPPQLGAGLLYSVSQGLRLAADGARIMRGTRKGEKSWALGAELNIAGDFFARGGRFWDAVTEQKGWSAGASWVGPRASLDYAMRTTQGRPHERDHVFGIRIQM